MMSSESCHRKSSIKMLNYRRIIIVKNEVEKHPEFKKNYIKVSWKAAEMGVVAKSYLVISRAASFESQIDWHRGCPGLENQGWWIKDSFTAGKLSRNPLIKAILNVLLPQANTEVAM